MLKLQLVKAMSCLGNDHEWEPVSTMDTKKFLECKNRESHMRGLKRIKNNIIKAETPDAEYWATEEKQDTTSNSNHMLHLRTTYTINVND